MLPAPFASAATAIRAVAVVAALAASAPTRADIVSQQAAARIGLTRPWFTQATLDRTRDSVAGAAIASGRLLVLTRSGNLQAFDVETGSILWSARVGSSNLLSLGPTASNGKCAVVNGATLYVFNAETGAEIRRRRLPGPAGAPAVVAERYAFTPLINGRIEGVPLDPDAAIDRVYASSGTTFDPASVIGEYLVWTTTRGYVYGADPKHTGAAYRFDTAGEPIGPAVGDADQVVIGTREGRIYSIRSNRGVEQWRVSVGGAINRPVVLQSGTVYVGTDEPALYAIDAKTAEQKWAVGGPDQYVAASAERVYALGPDGSLFIVDTATGRVLDRTSEVAGLMPVANTATDRMYFVSDSGMIQSLREIDATEPYRHDAGKPEQPTQDAAAPTDEGGLADEDDPFATDEPEAPAADDPANDPFADSDPFADPAPADAPGDDPADDPFDDPFDF